MSNSKAQIDLPGVSEARLEQIRDDIMAVLRLHKVTPRELNNLWESDQGTLLEHFIPHIGPIPCLNAQGSVDAQALRDWMLTPLPPLELEQMQ